MSSPAPSCQKRYLFVHSFPHSLSHHSETLYAAQSWLWRPMNSASVEHLQTTLTTLWLLPLWSPELFLFPETLFHFTQICISRIAISNTSNKLFICKQNKNVNKLGKRAQEYSTWSLRTCLWKKASKWCWCYYSVDFHLIGKWQSMNLDVLLLLGSSFKQGSFQQ